MPVRFRCENCESRIKVPDGSQGRRVRCPRCGHLQRVPSEAGAELDEAEASAPDAAATTINGEVNGHGDAEPSDIRADRSAEGGVSASEPGDDGPSESSGDTHFTDSADALAALAGAVGDPPQVAYGEASEDAPDEPPVSDGPSPAAEFVAQSPSPIDEEPSGAERPAESFVDPPANPPPSRNEEPLREDPPIARARPMPPTGIPLSRRPQTPPPEQDIPEPHEGGVEHYQISGDFAAAEARYQSPAQATGGLRLAPRSPEALEVRERHGRRDPQMPMSLLVVLSWVLRFLAALLAVVLAMYITPRLSSGNDWRAWVASLTISVSAGVLLWTMGEIAAAVDRMLRSRR